MEEQNWDAIWVGASLATMQGQDLGRVEDGLIAVREGRIVWVGPQREAPAALVAGAGRRHDLRGGWILPGFIDCHTHLVFAGNRAREFEMRLEGASYEEIARTGGGILSTVAATRAASDEDLLVQSLPRAQDLMREGVTTLEIKSGYGLDLETERRMLRTARKLGDTLNLDVVTSFLGAHALPPEYAGRSKDYIDLVCQKMLPALAEDGLVDAVDGFCEGIAFSPQEIRQVFETAKALKLPVKLHADQLSDLGGGALAAEFGALSADHLEFASEETISAMSSAGTVAVLLPGAFYALKETKQPPVSALREACVPLALATDCNPGSSPLSSIQLMLNMSCTLFGLTPTEALRGITVNAAKALALSADRGSLSVGMRADFLHVDVSDPVELCYWISAATPTMIVKDGALVSPA